MTNKINQNPSRTGRYQQQPNNTLNIASAMLMMLMGFLTMMTLYMLARQNNRNETHAKSTAQKKKTDKVVYEKVVLKKDVPIYPKYFNKRIEHAKKLSKTPNMIVPWMIRFQHKPARLGNLRIMSTLAVLSTYYASHGNKFGEKKALEIVKLAESVYQIADSNEAGNKKWQQVGNKLEPHIKSIDSNDKVYLLYLIWQLNYHAVPMIEVLEERCRLLIEALEKNPHPFLVKDFRDTFYPYRKPGSYKTLVYVYNQLGFKGKHAYGTLNTLILLWCYWHISSLDVKYDNRDITNKEALKRLSAVENIANIKEQIEIAKKFLDSNTDQKAINDLKDEAKKLTSKVGNLDSYNGRLFLVLHSLVLVDGPYIKDMADHMARANKGFLRILDLIAKQ